MIYHIKNPHFPEMRFEWHEDNKTVYMIRLGVEPLTGQAIARHIENHGAAHNAVQIWCRGYREARAELNPMLKVG